MNNREDHLDMRSYFQSFGLEAAELQQAMFELEQWNAFDATVRRPLGFLSELEHYFDTTPTEKIQSDWDASKEFDEVGPTVDAYLEMIESEFPDDEPSTPEIDE